MTMSPASPPYVSHQRCRSNVRILPPAKNGSAAGTSMPVVRTVTGFSFCFAMSRSSLEASFNSVSSFCWMIASNSSKAFAASPLKLASFSALSACHIACTTFKPSRCSTRGCWRRKAQIDARSCSSSSRTWNVAEPGASTGCFASVAPLQRCSTSPQNQWFPCLWSPRSRFSSWLPRIICALPLSTSDRTRRTTPRLSGPRSTRSPTKTRRRPSGWPPAPS
mmetsp:Transcript_73608/g.204586  ORF Transcript_73608/g.204586 Transcript_73608/m.204586 type:complete len:221 (-) Transcript_73608:359-1021(-)